DQALLHYHEAGQVACRIYAHTEAIHRFERAAALLQAHASRQARQKVSWETAAHVYESLGDVSLEIGSYQQASQAYHSAMTCVPEQEHLWQARLQRKVARSWRYVSTTPDDTPHINAHQAFQEAERILAHASDPSSPQWRYEWIELQFAQIWQTWPLRGSVEDMIATIDKVRPLVEQYGTDEQRELLSYAIAVRDLIHDRYVKSISQ